MYELARHMLAMCQLMQNFADKVVANTCYNMYAEANPLKTELCLDGRPMKVYLASASICVAPIPTTEFVGCNINKVVTDPGFYLHTLIFPTNAKCKTDVMNIKIKKVFHIEGNTHKILAHITLQMSQIVQVTEMSHEGFRKDLSAMDVQGVILYCCTSAPRSVTWLENIEEAMCETMWSDICNLAKAKAKP